MVAYRVVCQGRLYSGAEVWANTFHVDGVEPLNFTDVTQAFKDFYDGSATPSGVLFNCTGTIGSTGVTGVQLISIGIQRVTNPAPPVVTNVNLDGQQNSAGGLPSDVSFVVTWTTVKAGKSFRGRTYLPPFHTNKVTDANGFPTHLSSTPASAIATLSENLISDLAAADAPLVIYSRKLTDVELVTGGYIDDAPDTQRRRSNKQGAVRYPF